jgi:primosomal protein N'
MPRACPSCSSDKLSFLGFGTQKLEGELNKYIPDMRVMRMDADTTSGKLAYDKMLDDFRSERADILLGTQMVAKGHDFPKVTLVGVALADTSLFVSDFRASERTFSLLTQVIGRAGRAESGGVAVIQTYVPKNETIRLACLQDYEKFYEGEIGIRRELSYPPFCDLVQMTLTSEDEGALRKYSEKLSAFMEKLDSEYFTVCLDIGHAEMRGSQTSAVEMIRALGSRIKALHIHDNDQWHDSHQLPFTMKIDFSSVVDALREIKYDGIFTLEADCWLSGRTPENIFDGIKEMQVVARRLADMFEAK